MKRNIKILFFLFSLFCLNTYANQDYAIDRHYIIRVTSNTANKPAIPFTGSYVVNGKHGYRVISFLMGDKPMKPLVTPYEISVNVPWKVTAISTMLVAADATQNDSIKVEILEKQGDQKNLIIFGTGQTIVSTNDTNLLFNNVYSN